MKKIGGEKKSIGSSIFGALMVYLLLLSNLAMASGDTYLDNNFSLDENSQPNCNLAEFENCYNETILSCENVTIESFVENCEIIEDEVCEDLDNETICEIIEEEVCENVTIEEIVEECYNEEVLRCEIVEECVYGNSELNITEGEGINYSLNYSEELNFSENENLEILENFSGNGSGFNFSESINQSFDNLSEGLILDEFNNFNDELKIEIFQGDAVVGESVKWIKKIYTNNSNVSYEIPLGAVKVSERFVETNAIDGMYRIQSLQGYNLDSYLEVEYETMAPQIEEEDLIFGKKVVVWSNEHYENVTAFTNLSEDLGIVKIDGIRINWLEENVEIDSFDLEDLDEDGIYDYVSWVVPHLSNQTFEIIPITSAEHLDFNRSFIEDIYYYVEKLDEVFSPNVSSGEYVRVVFDEFLDEKKDITIYVDVVEGTPSVEVYLKNENELIAIFENLTNGENKVYLKNLVGVQDVFDLRVVGGIVRFDYIVDPWQENSLLHCKNVTIFNSFNSLENYPFYINVTNITGMNSDLSDVRFYDSPCDVAGNVLPHEIDDYDLTHADVWVLANLSSGDNVISMYYGNTTSVNFEDSSSDVWNENYLGVWHLGEDGSVKYDSTSNANSASNSGATTVSGLIGGAEYFDGTDIMVVPRTVDLEPTSAITVSLWINRDSVQNQWAKILWYGPNDNAPYGAYGFEFNSDSDSDIRWHTASSGTSYDTGVYSVSSGSWYLLTGVYSGTNSSYYVNGEYITSVSNPEGIGDYDGIDGLGFGDKVDTGQQYAGIIDEVSVSGVGRSGDWIGMNYEMVVNQNSIVTFSDEATANLPPSSPTGILCDGGSCDKVIDSEVNFSCYGSSDFEDDVITYFIKNQESFYLRSGDLEVGNQNNFAGQVYYMSSLYNYANCVVGSTCSTYEADSDQFPYGGNTANRNDYTQATAADYTAISAIQGSTWLTDDPGLNDEMTVWYNFNLNLSKHPLSSIQNINFNHYGSSTGAGTYSSWVLRDGGAYQMDSSWYQLGGTTSVPINTNTWVNRSLSSGLDAYINSGTGALTWLVYSSASSQAMNVEYAEIEVNYSQFYDNDWNYSWVNYTDYSNGDSENLTSIEITTQILNYNPVGSFNSGNSLPDLEVALYDGSGYVSGFYYNLEDFFGGSLENETDANVTISITDSEFLSAWESSVNRRFSIRSVNLDMEGGENDSVVWDGVWVSVNGRSLVDIGSHSDSGYYILDTSSFSEDYEFNLLCSSVDLLGSGLYSYSYEDSSDLIIDHTYPIISFSEGTFLNGDKNFYGYIYANASVFDLNFDSVVFDLYNSSVRINRTIYSYLDSDYDINWSDLDSGLYYYNVTVYDKSGKFNSTETRSVAIDVDIPIVEYAYGTEEDGSYVNSDYIFVNVSVEEENFENITFNLYDENGLFYSYLFFDDTRYVNWPFLENGIYYYNVTVFDSAGRMGFSETRNITLDSILPSGSLSSPLSGRHSNENSQNLTAEVSDESGLKEAILNIFDSEGFLINSTTIPLFGLFATIGFVYDFVLDGVYSWFYRVYDLADNYYDTNNNTIVIDTALPVLSLESIVNNSGQPYGSLYFYYNVTDVLSDIVNCSLIINDNEVSTSYSVSRNVFQNIFYEGLPVGSYNFSIMCFDDAGNLGVSELRYFDVVSMNSFSGVTTNLSNVDLSNVENFTLENINYGKIKYNENLDLRGGLDFDSLVVFSSGSVFVDSISQNNLNKSATIEFYSLDYEYIPIILKDGGICLDCEFNYYENGIFSFNVSSFSNYSLVENSALYVYNDAGDGGKGVGEDVFFYANYTDRLSGEIIDDAMCEINFVDGSYFMAYNFTSGLYEYDRDFSVYGVQNYDVLCYGAIDYENISVDDSFVIGFSIKNVYGEGFRTQSGAYNMVGDDEFILLDYEVSNLSSAFVIAPNMVNQENVSAATSGDPVINAGNSLVSLYLYNSTHIRAQRMINNDGPVVVTWQVLEALNNEFSVQRGEVSYSGTSQSISDTIPNPVSVENSMSWFYIRTSYTGNRADAVQFYSDIIDENTIQFVRDSSSVATSLVFRWEVVEWNVSKVGDFAKGYTGSITGDDIIPDCFGIGKTINKSSSILFHQSHSTHTGTGGLDSSTRAGYIQDDDTVCFYDYDGIYTAGVKWYLIDFSNSTNREEAINTFWGTTDYRDDVSFVNSYDVNNSLFFLSGTSNGDGTAFPRSTQWWEFDSSGFYVERTYGGQDREYSWQVLEVPNYENVDAPIFSDYFVSPEYAKMNDVIRFNLSVVDLSDEVSWVKGIVGEFERNFSSGANGEWYYDYVCQGDEEVSLSFVFAEDNSISPRINYTYVSNVVGFCDSTSPIVSFVSPDTPANGASLSGSSFYVNVSIDEVNFENITFELYNATGLVENFSYYNLVDGVLFSGLSTGVYYYNVTVYDRAGNLGFTETRSVAFDQSAPLISYGLGVLPSGEFSSHDSLFVNITVEDSSLKNVTFYLYDESMILERIPVTYTGSERSVTWTLLSDGVYYYNVVAYDNFGNFNSTEIRNVTIDTSLPSVSFTQNTKLNNSFSSDDYIFVEVVLYDENYENITFNLWNSSGVVSSQVFFDNTRSFNWTGLVDGVYYYNVTSFDLASNIGSTEIRTLTLDNQNPVVDFGFGTELDLSVVNNDYVYMNVSYVEENYANISFRLYNNLEEELSSFNSSSDLTYYNFTNLDSSLYKYKVFVYDKAGNFGETIFRSISLDRLPPVVNIIDPKPIAYGSEMGLLLNFTSFDEFSLVDSCWWNIDGGVNNSISCSGSTNFDTSNGQHVVNIYSNDTFGYMGMSSVAFLVSTGGPAIVLNEPINDTFYSGSTDILFEYYATDIQQVDSCSLYGSWNGGWHLNQTDYSFGLIGDDTIRTCSNTWPSLDCGASPLSAEGDNTWDSCISQGTSADESIEEMWVSGTELLAGETVEVTCYIDPYGTTNEVYMWYYNGSGWRTIYSGQAPSGTNYNLTQSFTVDNVVGEHWVRCGIGYDADDVSDFCVNAGSYFDNDDTSFLVVEPKTEGNFSVNIEDDGNYIWNINCNDTLGLRETALNNFTFSLDSVSPVLSFGVGTLSDGARVGVGSVYVNVSIIEDNLDNLTFYLYNSVGGLVSSQSYFNGKTNHSFSGLTSGEYYYNVTAYDRIGHVGFTDTRMIEIDVTNPSGTLVYPNDDTFSNNKTWNFTATVSDLVELSDATLFIYNSTGALVFSYLFGLAGMTLATIGMAYSFAYDDVFSWFYRVRDSVGNEYNITSYTIEIDSTAPEISFIYPTEESGEIVLRNWIFVNTSVYEKNYNNLTFWLYNSEGLLFENGFSNNVRSINWTLLPDGVYYYNVTSYDLADNLGVSGTREIILDDTMPIVNFVEGTSQNNSVVSGSSIFINVSVEEPNEENITFSLYNSVGAVVRENTFVDSRRSVNWTLLSEGLYYYNVTVYDKVGLKGSTETRMLVLDNTYPVVNYANGTEISNVNKSQNWIFVNTTIEEENFKNVTFSLMNSVGSRIQNRTFTSLTTNFNFTGLSNGIYYYDVVVYDKGGFFTSLPTRKITLDTVLPVINYISPTENDYVIRSRDWIFVNVSVFEINLKSLKFELRDSFNSLVDSVEFTNSTKFYNFTGLEDNNYRYNVVAYDWANNTASSEIRNIGLDLAGPIVNIVKPESKVYGYNESLPLEHFVYDKVSSVDSCWWNIDDGVNNSIVCGAITTFNASVNPHVVNFYANDTYGRVGHDSVSFSISLTGPAVNLISPVNDTFYSVATNVDFNFMAEDPDSLSSCSLYSDLNGDFELLESWDYSEWYHVEWAKRKSMVVPSSNINSDLVDFPLLIELYDSDLKNFALSDGKDILFTNEDGSSSLDYEIEEYDSDYNSTHAKLLVWVKVNLSSTYDNVFYVYYNNSDVNSQENAEEVWDSDFVGVWHKDDVTTLTIKDSTLNQNNGTKYALSEPFETEGLIGMAQSYDGSDGFIELGTSGMPRTNDSMTLEAWAYFTGTPGTQNLILINDGTAAATQLGFRNNAVSVWMWGGSIVVSSALPTANVWHHYVFTTDGVNHRLYVDGVETATSTTALQSGAANEVRINTNSWSETFVGLIDESRISTAPRSSEWIRVSYENQFSPMDFYSVGISEELYYNFSALVSQEGDYLWNVKCNDTIGYDSFALNNYSFVVDVTNPQVFFGFGTEDNESISGVDWVYVDANVIENNFENITFDLYNEEFSRIRTNSFYDDVRSYNFTGLSDGVYYYDIKVYDKAGRMGSSEIRNIILDLSSPSGNLESPSNGSYVRNLVQNLSASFSDTSGLLNATLYVLNSIGEIIYSEVVSLGGVLFTTVGVLYNFVSEGVYQWFYGVEDVVGNEFNTTISILTVDTTSPFIDYGYGVEESGGIFERETIYVNVTTGDLYFSNLTFSFFNDEGVVFEHTFSDGTTEITSPIFSDDTYYYNVTASDLAGNVNSTETRNITLDNLNPSISYGSLTKPNGAFVSGDSVYVDVVVVEPNEANVTFRLYNSTNSIVRSNTFVNGERSVNWNLLLPGVYYYNVTIYDEVGHFASTNTRQIIVDDFSPVVSYDSFTELNNSAFARNFVYVGVNVVEDNFQNLTINLYNSTSLIESQFFTGTTRSYNFTGLNDGVYYYNATVYDKAGNLGIVGTRILTLDNVNPLVSFSLGTESDGYVKTSDWIFVNVSVLETNFANITFSIYDNLGLFDFVIFENETREFNFTNLPSNIYYYNISVYDDAGNVNSTETRSIGIDYLGPFIQIVDPKARAYGYNIGLPLNYNVNDAISSLDSCWYNLDLGSNVTVDCFSSSSFDTSDGQHTLHFYSNDSFGNLGYSNITFLVSTTGPAIQLIEPEDETFYSEGETVFFSYVAEDPDLTESCSLYGSWNGEWHLNQTDYDWIFGDLINFTETFELYQTDTTTSFVLNWTNAVDDQCQWGSDKGGTASGSTGPSVDVTLGTATGIYVYLESSTSGTNFCGTTGYEANLISDELDANLNNYNISFWYHMYGVTMGSLNLDVYHDGAWENGVWSSSGDLGDTWFNQVVDLSDYEGLIRLRLRGVRGTSYTSDMALDDIRIISTPGGNKPSGNFTVDVSEEGTHLWNVKCNDTKGYDTWAVSNYSITFDVTNPVVNFGSGTLENNSNVSQNYVYVNSSIVENNFKNITFYLMNESGEVLDFVWFNDSRRSYNFTSLLDGVYYYNISVYDKADRLGVSPTRVIKLDTTSPAGGLISPENNSITKDRNQNLTGSFSDENGLKEVVLYIFNQTGYVYSEILPLGGIVSSTIGVVYEFLFDGLYSWFFGVEDMVGNKYNTTSNSIIIDTTLPVVSFVDLTLENNTYISNNFIYLNSSIVEANFANITFYLYNDEGIVSPSPNTFLNFRRDINWTNLLDDEYYYNVTVWDLAGNYNSSETRKIILDNVLPTLAYSSGTAVDNANVSGNHVYVNVSAYDVNFDNITYVLYNSSGVLNSTTYYSNVNNINWTGLSDGTYYYNVSVYDKAGLNRSLVERKINLDTVVPLLSFVSPTSSSGSVFERDWIYLETTMFENNFKEIRYGLYNESGLINETIYSLPILNINFTASSENKTYWYNVTVYDWAGNFGSTSTRNISLVDVTNPSLIMESPKNMNYSFANGIRLSYVASDVHLDSCWYNVDSGVNITLPNCQDTSINVEDEEWHTLNLYVNDTLGYMNISSATFFVNSSAILTPTYSVLRGESFADGYVEEAVDQIDMSKAFILHSVRGSDNGPDSLHVISKFLDVNTIAFENYVSGEPVIVDWALIVGPGISVQRGEISFGDEMEVLTSINSVNLSNSFIIVNSRVNSGDSNDNVDGFFVADFVDDSTIGFSRGLNGSSGELSFQVVSWEGVNVQSGNLTLRAGDTSVSEIISSVNLDNSILIFSNSISSAVNARDVSVRSEFLDSSNLNFVRTGVVGDSEISYFVLESDLFYSEMGEYSHLLNSDLQEISLSRTFFNSSRSFSLNSYDSSTSGTQYSTVFVTDEIVDNETIGIQKGAGVGSGISNWFAVEIADLNNPEVELISPIENYNYSTHLIPGFSFEYDDESALLNCSLYGSWNGGWHLNQTVYSEISFSSILLNESGFYNWSVECYDIYGNYNTTENRTFSSFLPPTEPMLINITQSSNDGKGNVFLDWEDSSDVVSYRIYAGSNASNLSFADEVYESNYTDVNFSGNKRKFYRVEAWNPSSANYSSELFGAHVYTFEHNLGVSGSVKNRNWIGFPTNFSYIETAKDMKDEMNGIVSATSFDEDSQKRVTCNDFSCPESFACTDTNCNFDILPGRGYEVNLNTSEDSLVNWSGVGIVYDAQDLTLYFDETLSKTNKNWISMIAHTTLTDARSLYNSIGVADAVTNWNTIKQSSEGLIPSPFPWMPGVMGTNFNLEIEKGYEVSIIEDTIWRQE